MSKPNVGYITLQIVDKGSEWRKIIRAEHFINLVKEIFPEDFSGKQFVDVKTVLSCLTEISSAEIADNIRKNLHLEAPEGRIFLDSPDEIVSVPTIIRTHNSTPTTIETDGDFRYRNVHKFNKSRLLIEYGRMGVPYDCSTIAEGRTELAEMLNREYASSKLNPIALEHNSDTDSEVQAISPKSTASNSNIVDKITHEQFTAALAQIDSTHTDHKMPNNQKFKFTPQNRPRINDSGTHPPQSSQKAINENAQMPFPNYPQKAYSKRPLFEPPKFSGAPTEDIFSFIKTYEKAGRVNNWDEEMKIDLLENYLSNTAHKYLKSQPLIKLLNS